jgi:hypothetical protein
LSMAQFCVIGYWIFVIRKKPLFFNFLSLN